MDWTNGPMGRVIGLFEAEKKITMFFGVLKEVLLEGGFRILRVGILCGIYIARLAQTICEVSGLVRLVKKKTLTVDMICVFFFFRDPLVSQELWSINPHFTQHDVPHIVQGNEAENGGNKKSRPKKNAGKWQLFPPQEGQPVRSSYLPSG